MEDISLHVLDIVENSIRAGASEISIAVLEDPEHDILEVVIHDDGRGMDEETVQNVVDPFFTSKEDKRVGLGIPLLAQAAREGGGDLKIESKVREGTKITATFVWSHPDRKPMGDMDGTIRLLTFTHPEISFVYEYNKAK